MDKFNLGNSPQLRRIMLRLGIKTTDGNSLSREISIRQANRRIEGHVSISLYLQKLYYSGSKNNPSFSFE